MKRHPIPTRTAGIAAGIIVALSALGSSPKAAGQGGWEQLGDIPNPVGPIADITVDGEGTIFALTLSFGPPLQSRIVRSSDKGKSWEALPTAEKLGPVTAVTADKSGRLWADSEKGLFRSEDKGENWTQVPLPTESSTGTGDIVISPTGGITLIKNHLTSLQFFISTDSGKTWLSTESDRAVPYASQSYYYLHNDGNFYVSGAEGFLRYAYEPSTGSYRYDKSFNQQINPIYHYVPIITGSAATGMIYIASYNGAGTSMERISRSSNKGSSWATLYELMPGGESWETIGIVVTQADELILITRTQGIFFSFNQGQDWQKIGTALPGGIPIGLYANEADGTLYATEKNGTKIFYTTRGASDVEESAENGSLGKNDAQLRSFPNPSDHASIEYTLSAPGKTDITISNGLGVPVRRLRDESKSGGKHLLFWDGTDDMGRPLPSGVYFITLHREGKGIASTTMTLMR